LKHLESSLTGLQVALGTGKEMAVRMVWLDVLRNLGDFRVMLVRLDTAGQWKAEQNKFLED
jgi:hypothetical protein